MPASTLSPQAVQRAPHCPICKRTIEVRRLKRDDRFWTCDGCMVAWIETHTTTSQPLPERRLADPSTT